MKVTCTKKCYVFGKLYEKGEELELDEGQAIPAHFAGPEEEAKKPTIEAEYIPSTLKELQEIIDHTDRKVVEKAEKAVEAKTKTIPPTLKGLQEKIKEEEAER